ncbi:hypothetical protein [Sphingobacterium sp. LRF_L2]|uniref:hypothetical protein n=1 Tax=Sphingobacterium sp. LRF_L2 TaxID=3369421 RepID=UPI003F5EFED5
MRKSASSYILSVLQKISLLCLIFGCKVSPSFSQNQILIGDSVSYERFIPLIKHFKLTSLQDTFRGELFRYGDQNQIIELVKTDVKTEARLVNYIHHYKRKNYKSNLVYSKINLSIKDVEMLEYLLHKYRIDTLPSQKDIKTWQRGADGATYTFEFSNSKQTKIASYWSPESQHSAEAQQLRDFINQLDDSLGLTSHFDQFKQSLPHKGCYLIGNMMTICYHRSPLYIGYSATNTSPIGYSLSKGFPVFQNKNYLMLHAHHRFSKQQKNYDILLEAHLSKLLLKQKTVDFLATGYRKRKLEIDSGTVHAQNLQLMYGVSYKKITLGLGADHLTVALDKILGVRIHGTYQPWKFLNVYGKTSIFNSRTDYELGMNIYPNINNFFVKNIAIELFTERFLKQQQYGVGLTFGL